MRQITVTTNRYISRLSRLESDISQSLLGIAANKTMIINDLKSWHAIIIHLQKTLPLNAYIILPSHHSVKETIDRLVISLQRNDMIIYARINRQIEARWYGNVTQPMEFILFDDPRLSASMVKRNPVVALCFPMRIIAWEDEIGRCRVAYKDPLEIKKEFLVAECDYQWPDLQPEITRALED